MKITIDTRYDKKEDIEKVLKILAESQSSVFNKDQPTEPIMGMFDQPPSEGVEQEKSEETDQPSTVIPY